MFGESSNISTMNKFEMQNFSQNGIGYSGWKFDDPPIWEPFSWEIIDKEAWINYALDTWKLPIYTGMVYIAAIFTIQNWMKDRPAFDLKGPLFYWNAALGIFSVMGLIRFTPSFLNILFGSNGFYRSICVRDGANEPASFWTLLFVLSKYVELGDTVFIVLRKRPLVFLQWYHHMITCCVAWILAPFVEPVARWYIVMNYAVHSFMYPYFALKARDVDIPRQISNTITSMQLLQMIIGLFVNLYTMFLIKMGDSVCSRHPVSVKVFGLVYGSFVFLFGKLFYESFFLGGKGKTKKIE